MCQGVRAGKGRQRKWGNTARSHKAHGNLHTSAQHAHPPQTDIGRLPVYGVGHSLGSVLHMLICARYTPNVRGAGGDKALGSRIHAVGPRPN